MYKHKLPNGVTVLVDSDPRFSSVSLAISLHGGLRSENLETVGLTHLCEHLLFKRTATKNPLQIAQLIDSLGGEVNAFTDADCLCVHGLVPAPEAAKLFDFFAEIMLQTSFTEKDLELEREVIRQEILDSKDDPIEVAYRKFSTCFWPNSILGYPVFGDLEHLESFSYGDVYERLHSLLQGDKVIIVASGAISPEEVLAFAEKNFAHLAPGRKAELERPVSASGLHLFQEKFSQVHFALGCPAAGMADSKFDACAVIASVLGGGVSSRLFQALRENHGLVYDISAGLDIHADTSALLVTGACELDNLPMALELLVSEIANLKAKKIDVQELQRIISSHRAQLQMEDDSISSRMWRALESEMMHGRQITNKEIIERLDKLTLAEVNALVDGMLANCLLVIVGDVEEFEPSETIRELCGEREG